MADFQAFGAALTRSANPDTSFEARGALFDNIRGTPIIRANQEEQRKEAMRLLRAIVNLDLDPNTKVTLTLAEAFFRLVPTGWDVEAAVLRWASEEIIRWQLYHTFDHPRSDDDESDLPIPRLSGSQRALQRRQDNMAAEDSIPDIDARAEAHRRYSRAEANQYYSDTVALFLSEAEVAERVRLTLQAELRNGNITAQQAAVVHRLMRTMSMVPPEEGDAISNSEAMEEGDHTGDREPSPAKLDDEISNFDTPDCTDCSPDDIMGLES